MKRLLFVLVMILGLVGSVEAAPFLICDPQTGVTHYKLTGPAWVTSPVTAQPDGSLRMDIATANQGNNSLTVSACKTDALWGELCSPFVGFDFVRPDSPVGPLNLRLSN